MILYKSVVKHYVLHKHNVEIVNAMMYTGIIICIYVHTFYTDHMV